MLLILVVFCCLLPIFTVHSGALIEIKQVGLVERNGFNGIGCAAGIITGIHVSCDMPQSICGTSPIDATSIIGSIEYEKVRLDCNKLVDENIGFGGKYREFALCENNQPVVIVTNSFEDARNLLSQYVDESLILARLPFLTN